MNREAKNGLFTFAMFWVVGISAAVVTQSLNRAQGPERQTAIGIDSIIHCLYAGENNWRIALAAYMDQYQISLGQPAKSGLLHPFSDALAQGKGLSNLSFGWCSSDIQHDVRSIGNYPSLIALGVRYSENVAALKELDSRLDTLYRNTSNEPPTAEQRDLHERLQHAAGELFKTSQALRGSLEYFDIRLRPEQLDRLVDHHAPDQYWYTLNFMLTARLAIDTLDSEAHKQSLSPAQLQLIDDHLHIAWKEGNAYMSRFPRLEGSQNASSQLGLWARFSAHQPTLWAQINVQGEATSFLTAVDKLLIDWRAHSEPSLLSADYSLMGQAYDKMLNQYNDTAWSY